MSERDPMNQELDDLRAEVKRQRKAYKLLADSIDVTPDERLREANTRRLQAEAEVERLAKALVTKQSRLDYCIKENTELLGLMSMQNWRAE